MLELVAFLALAGALGLPGAWRWLAFGLAGPFALVVAVLWWQRAGAAVWVHWAAIAACAGFGLTVAAQRIKRTRRDGAAAAAAACARPAPEERRVP